MRVGRLKAGDGGIPACLEFCYGRIELRVTARMHACVLNGSFSTRDQPVCFIGEALKDEEITLC